MKYKKSLLILIMAIFLVSIAGVCASDANDTAIAGDDSNQMELSSGSEISEDDLQTSEENTILTQNDDETVSAQTDSERLNEGDGTYEYLINEIGIGGDKNLSKSYYSYNGGNTIEIRYPGVINGNGAIIDMAGANIRAFNVNTSGVTIKNLTIKNANCSVNGGAIYFNSSGTVENCNFIDNKETGSFPTGGWGGAIYFNSNGSVINCNFTNNTAGEYGGAIYIKSGNVTNCNFADNQAVYYGGAIYMDSGNVTNCNFTDNSAKNGGAINIYSGNVTNCNFNNNKAEYAGAIYCSNGIVENCNFINNHLAGNFATYGGAISFIHESKAINCIFINNSAPWGGGAICNGVADTCIFKTDSDTTYQTDILSPYLMRIISQPFIIPVRN